MSPRLLRISVTAVCALALLLPVSRSASAVSQSGTDSRPAPSRVFAASAPFYQKLPDRTPAASKSKKLVAGLNA
jgi:hypothetical protein